MDGIVNHRGRGDSEGRGEDRGGLIAGDLTGQVIGLAIKIHRRVGPGLLEHIYEDCLCQELTLAGIVFQRQVKLSLDYDGTRLPRAYRADIVVEEKIVLEIKAIEQILPVHEAQILTYMHLSGCSVGLFLNFNTALLKNGLRRFVQSSSPRPPLPPRPQ
jgi:GxxExxY protein